MKKYAFLLLLPLTVVAFARWAHPTAFHSYVSFKGTKQGQFKGESSKGREKDGWFAIVAFEFSVEAPVDPKSGRPAAKPKNKPIVITKEVDAASPLLLNAHYTNETFESIIIQTLDDQNKVTKTITLKNAVISDIKKNGTTEAVSFNYDGIVMQP